MADETSRPRTLAEVAERSTSLAEFGRNLQDWLHSIRRMSSRSQVQTAIWEEPRFLAPVFTDGALADAYLAAYAELAASRAAIRAPDWAFSPTRTLELPWFADNSSDSAVRRAALLYTPLAFKRRNLYATRVAFPLRRRPGRPLQSTAEKRLKNAERQRRFRARRKLEWERLRRKQS